MGRIKKIKIPTKYDEELAYIHAVICGDGTLIRNGYKIQISDKCFDVHSKTLKPAFRKLFGIKVRIVKKGNGWITETKSKLLFNYLSNNLKIPIGEKSGIVSISPKLFYMPPSVQISHLRGWMDAEGSVKYRKYKTVTTPKIEFVSKSKNVRDRLSKILKNNGLLTWKWTDKENFFRFELAGPRYVIKYNKLIGFRHPHKRVKLRKLIRNYNSCVHQSVGSELLS